MDIPLSCAFTLKFHNYDIFHCPGIVFLDIQKKSQKKIGILISLKCFVPAQYKKMQFVDKGLIGFVLCKIVYISLKNVTAG